MHCARTYMRMRALGYVNWSVLCMLYWATTGYHSDLICTISCWLRIFVVCPSPVSSSYFLPNLRYVCYGSTTTARPFPYEYLWHAMNISDFVSSSLIFHCQCKGPYNVCYQQYRPFKNSLGYNASIAMLSDPSSLLRKGLVHHTSCMCVIWIHAY